MVNVVRNISKLPPSARGLVAAVLGFAIGVMRTIVAMMVLNLAIDAAGALIKDTMVGRALVLQMQARLFSRRPLPPEFRGEGAVRVRGPKSFRPPPLA